MKFIVGLLFFSSSLLTVSLQAQSILKGIVKSETGTAVPYASIQLLQPDSTFVQGTATDSTGNYKMTVRKGEYLMSVSSIGYLTKTIPVISNGENDRTLPVITLQTNNIMLNNVEIKGSSFIRKDDRILIIPDKQQLKHSHTGYDLLYNLMIPGMDVDRRKGTVSAMGGNATLYIDGREADYREIKNLRPKDIERIEYMDMPTGEYAGDKTSVNFITKKRINGGYVSADADQTIGYLKGDYNLGVKLYSGNTSYTLFGGHSMQEYENEGSVNTETYYFPEHSIVKQGNTDLDRKKNNRQYAQLNILNQTNKRKLMAKMALVHSEEPGSEQESSLTYSELYPSSSSHSRMEQRSLKPSLNLYGEFRFNKNQKLQCTLNGDYTDNSYDRSYLENKFISHSNVQEEMYTLSPSVKYYAKFKHGNSLTAQVRHIHRISSTTYKGDSPSWQHLWSGETLLFLNYNHKLSKKLTLDAQAGMSSLQYRLHGQDKISRISPRGSVALMYSISKKQFLGGGMAVGNAYPEINTINTAEQTVDMLHVKRGNPYLPKISMYSASANYSVQFGRFNLFGIFMYDTEINTTLPAFFIEGDKVVETFRGDGDYHSFRGGLDLSYKVTDALRLKISGRWQRGLITGTEKEHENSVYGKLDINYFWKDFALNIYGQMKSKELSMSGIYSEQDGCYGLSLSWNHGNWSLEGGTNNPFIDSSKTRNYLTSEVYSFDRYQYYRYNQRSGYVKVAYTFEFGKKTSRDRNDVDYNINSAILKVE